MQVPGRAVCVPSRGYLWGNLPPCAPCPRRSASPPKTPLARCPYLRMKPGESEGHHNARAKQPGHAARIGQVTSVFVVMSLVRGRAPTSEPRSRALSSIVIDRGSGWPSCSVRIASFNR